MLRKKKQELNTTSAKKTYLANMSHEIRTPMNAIVGLSDILLRECKDPDMREHLHSMQSATRNLLMTINNILDYENMLEGKIRIEPDAYNIEDLLSEVIEITKINIAKKEMLFLVEANPNIPKRLYGDVARIKQILCHLISNAEKFTKVGYIKLSVDFEKEAGDAILHFSVEDTGCGIKESDLEKVRAAYTQQDDSSTRDEGGLGIGLTIAEALLKLMGTNLNIESKEGIGTKVSFFVRNKIVEESPAMKIDDAGDYNIGIFLEEKNEDNAVKSVFDKLGIKCEVIDNVGELFIANKGFTHLVTSRNKYEQMRDIQEIRALKLEYLVGVDYTSQMSVEPNATFFKKPLWFGEIKDILTGDNSKSLKKETINIHGSRILIIDDNDINLRVTAGLLKPYGAAVDTATNAEDGIRLATKGKYDLVFMDHMMPGTDGVEATKIIRSYEDPYYRSIPIIALSANAIEGAEDLFMRAGMNDFLEKPVKLKELENILKKWIPSDKLKVKYVDVSDEYMDIPVFSDFKNIDVNVGLSFTNGDAAMYKSIVEEYAQSIDAKKTLLDNLAETGDVARFTIEVHSLKSLSKTIGAIKLSEVCLNFERLGHKRDTDTIKNTIDRLDDEIDSVKKDLEPLIKGVKSTKVKHPFNKEKVRELLRELYYAADDFDYDNSVKLMFEIDGFTLSERLEKECYELNNMIENLDYGGVKEKAVEILILLEM